MCGRHLFTVMSHRWNGCAGTNFDHHKRSGAVLIPVMEASVLAIRSLRLPVSIPKHQDVWAEESLGFGVPWKRVPGTNRLLIHIDDNPLSTQNGRTMFWVERLEMVNGAMAFAHL